jgi:hypothetical protein
MFTNDDMIDVAAIIDDYKAGTDIATLATRYSKPDLALRKSDISAYLRANRVPIRRGNPKLAELAKAAAAVRTSKALTNKLTKLVISHGYPAVLSELTSLGDSHE